LLFFCILQDWDWFAELSKRGYYLGENPQDNPYFSRSSQNRLAPPSARRSVMQYTQMLGSHLSQQIGDWAQLLQYAVDTGGEDGDEDEGSNVEEEEEEEDDDDDDDDEEEEEEEEDNDDKDDDNDDDKGDEGDERVEEEI